MAIKLDEAYLTTTAEKKAEEFTADKLDKNQLRKFYDEFMVLNRKIYENINEEKFQKEILPLIKFLKAKIAYNAGRKVNNKILIPDSFKKYLDGEIDKIQSINDFKNFILHYQAIIGYFTYFNKDKK